MTTLFKIWKIPFCMLWYKACGDAHFMNNNKKKKHYHFYCTISKRSYKGCIWKTLFNFKLQYYSEPKGGASRIEAELHLTFPL